MYERYVENGTFVQRHNGFELTNNMVEFARHLIKNSGENPEVKDEAIDMAAAYVSNDIECHVRLDRSQAFTVIGELDFWTDMATKLQNEKAYLALYYAIHHYADQVGDSEEMRMIAQNKMGPALAVADAEYTNRLGPGATTRDKLIAASKNMLMTEDLQITDAEKDKIFDFVIMETFNKNGVMGDMDGYLFFGHTEKSYAAGMMHLAKIMGQSPAEASRARDLFIQNKNEALEEGLMAFTALPDDADASQILSVTAAVLIP